MALKLAYIALTVITIFFLIFIGIKAINSTSNNLKKDKITLVFSLLLWQVFIFCVSLTEWIKSYEFPPRFAIAFIVPSFIFTGVFLYQNRNKKWINSIPEHWIIYFQSFRILVEILFVFTVAKGILNYHVSIEGYNYDMIFAFTAPIIAFLVYNLKLLTRKVILIWNYVGILVLASVIFVFTTCIYKPQIYGSEIPLLPIQAFTYPYVLIAGFLMPTAVFLHVLSIFQLSSKYNSINN